MKNSELESAYFIQRLVAYIFDIIIISLISTIITMPLIDTKAVEKYNDEAKQIATSYANHQIDVSTYLSKVVDISYDQMQVTGLSNIITIAILVLYFIVYQIYNDGQTLGKKMMHIKIVKCDDGDLEMNDLILRNLFTNSILADILIATITLCGKNIYFYGSSVVKLFQFVFLLITVLMIMIRKDGRGIPDILANTKVVSLKVKIKEDELCEN